MLRTVKTTATDRHVGLTLAELALFYSDAQGAGAPAGSPVKAELTIGGKLKAISVEWEAEQALNRELELAGIGAARA